MVDEQDPRWVKMPPRYQQYLRKAKPETKALLWSLGKLPGLSGTTDEIVACCTEQTGMVIHRHQAAACLRSISRIGAIQSSRPDDSSNSNAQWAMSTPGHVMIRALYSHQEISEHIMGQQPREIPSLSQQLLGRRTIN